jgi:F-type H+-transporting ATPase subunit a
MFEKIAPQSLSVLLGFATIFILMIMINQFIKKSDPLKINNNKQNLVELFFDFFETIVRDIVGESYVPKLTPLAITIFTTILITNIAGLIGLKEGALLNPTYTFTWSISMFIFWNLYVIKVIGIKAFLGDFVKPFAFMLPLEIIGFLTKPISMGFRLVGNITAGAVFMMLFWMVPEALQEMSNFGILAVPIFVYLGSFLSFYFSLFGPIIQALVFTYLTMVNIGTLVNEE